MAACQSNQAVSLLMVYKHLMRLLCMKDKGVLTLAHTNNRGNKKYCLVIS